MDDTSDAFSKGTPYASDYKLSTQSTKMAKTMGSRPVSRAAARKHFSTSHKREFKNPRRPKTSGGIGKSGRFNETMRASDGRVHSKVNHFEEGADKYEYGGWEPEGRSTFGSTAPRFVDTGRVHAGLIDGYSASQVAKGIKPGRLRSTNATSASNPLATSTYQVMEHADARSAPAHFRARPRPGKLSTSNATSASNPLATSSYQVMDHADARSAPSHFRARPRPGKLSTSNATSASNPLATSSYQVMEHAPMPGRRRR